MSLLESWNWCFFLSPWILKIFEEDIWFHRPNPTVASFIPPFLGGQYKMYNSLIFINFISRSKKVKTKMLTCVWSLCSANKTLTFFIILNLKFLDQLERRHCKDTPYFRPFYIGAPKGPFLWGLRKEKTGKDKQMNNKLQLTTLFTLGTMHFALLCCFLF
jgi:hypothetical protein